MLSRTKYLLALMAGLVVLALFRLGTPPTLDYSDVVRSSPYFLDSRGSPGPEVPRELYDFAVNTPGCRVPAIDPLHPSVMRYYRNITDSLKCPGKPDIIKIISKDTIQLDEKVLREHYNTDAKVLSCSYKEIMRNNDDSWQYGPETPLVFNKPLSVEYLRASCKIPGRLELSQFVSLFPDPPEPLVKQPTADITEPLNVLVVGIDSISRVNFQRHFTKTYKYLKDTLKAVELRGYHKVDDNTFPNLTPFLTGNFKEYYWNEDNKTDIYFDNVDFIWKHYKKNGYRTLYFEDMTPYGTFNFYKKKGFKEKPVDHYYRPMSMAMESVEPSNYQCFNDRLQYEVLWDYLRRYTKAFDPSQLLYSFAFVSRLTHDDQNYAAYIDTPAYELLQDLYDSKILNRSILVFFSDHGVRVGSLRPTISGYYEERMPMCFLVFPQWFKEKYPNIYKTLKINERRLTTHFDVHATLHHFLNFKKEPPRNVNYPYGISLFSEIPEDRTCEDAGVKPHWCGCKVYEPVFPEDPMVKRAVMEVERTLNSWIDQTEGRCSHLRASSLNAVARYTRETSDGKLVSDYMVSVTTQPGGGVFEATLEYHHNTDTLTVRPQIGRINNYGNNAYCLKEGSFAFKYCYCV